MSYSARKIVLVYSTDYKDCSEVTTASKSITTISKPNKCLALVHVDRGGNAITSVSMDGRSFTRAIIGTIYDGCYTEVWYLLQPPVGTFTATVNFAGVTQSYAQVGFVSMYNVDQVSPIDITSTKYDTVGNFTNSFSVAFNGSLVVEGQFNNGIKAGSPNSGQTIIRERSGNDSGGSSYKAVNAGVNSVGWYGFENSSISYSHALAVFKPAKKAKGGIQIFTSTMGI